MRASARSIRRSTAATPAGFFRSTAMLRRPRARRLKRCSSPGGPPTRLSSWPTLAARSTRMTSAPISDNSIAQNGPGPIPASSTILTPSSGPIWPFLFFLVTRQLRTDSDQIDDPLYASSPGLSLLDSHKSPEVRSVGDCFESEQAVEGDHWSGLAIIAGPAAEPGTHPSGVGERG